MNCPKCKSTNIVRSEFIDVNSCNDCDTQFTEWQQAEIERLTFLHNLDHSLVDQKVAEIERLTASLTNYIKLEDAYATTRLRYSSCGRDSENWSGYTYLNRAGIA
jgi:hypothetical protein